MRRLQHQMTALVDQILLAAGVVSPKQESFGRRIFAEEPYGSIGQTFPTFSPMGPRLPCPNRQNSIEQKHTLPRPSGEIPTIGLDTAVGLQLPVNVS